MEIQALKLLITEADLAAALKERLAGQEGVEGLQAALLPEGVKLQGEYATGFGFKVPFETVWGLTASGPTVQAKLDAVKVAGLPAGILRGALLRMLRDAVEGQAGVRVEQETVQIDLPAVAAEQGVELRVNLTAVRLAAGELVVEAG
ncbi:MAG: hypothetical protein U0797_10015 [Gemmataceae bacterium]